MLSRCISRFKKIFFECCFLWGHFFLAALNIPHWNYLGIYNFRKLKRLKKLIFKKTKPPPFLAAQPPILTNGGETWTNTERERKSFQWIVGTVTTWLLPLMFCCSFSQIANNRLLYSIFQKSSIEIRDSDGWRFVRRSLKTHKRNRSTGNSTELDWILERWNLESIEIAISTEKCTWTSCQKSGRKRRSNNGETKFFVIRHDHTSIER